MHIRFKFPADKNIGDWCSHAGENLV